MMLLLLAQAQDSDAIAIWDRLLPYIIPSTIGLIGVLIGHILLARKYKKEQELSESAQDTDAFRAVTDKLMALAESADTRASKVEARVAELEAQKAVKEKEIETLHHEMSSMHAELAEVRRVNTSISAYLGKLITAWPVGVRLPPPDDKIDFTKITGLYPQV